MYESIEIPQSPNITYRPIDFQPNFSTNINYDNKSFGIPITNSEYSTKFVKREGSPRASIPRNTIPISSYPQPIYTNYRPWGQYNPSPIYVIREEQNQEQIKRAAPPTPPVNQLGIGEDQKIRVLSDEIDRQREINILTYIKFNELKIEKTDLRNHLAKVENEIDYEQKKNKNNQKETLERILEDKNRELAFLIESRSKLTNDELNSLIWKVKEREIDNGHLRERTAQLEQSKNCLMEDFGNIRNEIYERRLARR